MAVRIDHEQLEDNTQVRVRGAREHNLKDVDVELPRNALVVFTGVSGSGKSSLAFGTLYAEAQRRYLESVSPYARRLFDQMPVPDVDSIDGLPPAVALQQQTVADVLRMTVDEAWSFFAGEPAVLRTLEVVRQVGLGYLRLGQPATELSGGEAQRIKLASELQRAQRGGTLYVLDEPTTGLHPADIVRLMTQLEGLVDAGNTVIVVEHEMRVVAGSDWVIDVGPGAGEEGGRIVTAGLSSDVARCASSKTAPYLARFQNEAKPVTRREPAR